MCLRRTCPVQALGGPGGGGEGPTAGPVTGPAAEPPPPPEPLQQPACTSDSDATRDPAGFPAAGATVATAAAAIALPRDASNACAVAAAAAPGCDAGLESEVATCPSPPRQAKRQRLLPGSPDTPQSRNRGGSPSPGPAGGPTESTTGTLTAGAGSSKFVKKALFTAPLARRHKPSDPLQHVERLLPVVGKSPAEQAPGPARAPNEMQAVAAADPQGGAGDTFDPDLTQARPQPRQQTGVGARRQLLQQQSEQDQADRQPGATPHRLQRAGKRHAETFQQQPQAQQQDSKQADQQPEAGYWHSHQQQQAGMETVLEEYFDPDLTQAGPPPQPRQPQQKFPPIVQKAAAAAEPMQRPRRQQAARAGWRRVVRGSAADRHLSQVPSPGDCCDCYELKCHTHSRSAMLDLCTCSALWVVCRGRLQRAEHSCLTTPHVQVRLSQPAQLMLHTAG